MKMARQALLLAFGLLGFSVVAPAYYYWAFYPSGDGPFTPVPGRFDVARLPDRTVQYFISAQGPAGLVPSDTQTAIFSEIQQAAATWSQVPGSALRLRFGGIASTVNTASGQATLLATPGIDVIFDDDMPPGILAQTKPTFPEDLSFLYSNPKNPATFVPILRSRIQLRSDLAKGNQASYSDAFFLTLVHEFGHAVGLQHSLTSGVMSTAITRATLKGTPLSPDDVAGVAHLYPSAAFPVSYLPSYPQNTGSITGRVSLREAGVRLASVVALAASGVNNGTAISAMTNPDGSYQIDGLPPGSYYVYAHALPPALAGERSPANILAPADPQGDDFSAQTEFATQLYPGTQEWTRAKQVNVAPQAVSGKIDFAVVPRQSAPIHSLETYGYEQSVPIASPPLVGKTRNSIVFHAFGATVNHEQQMAPGLRVGVIGSAAAIEKNSLKYYTQGYLLMTVATAEVAGPTPVALALNLNDDLYILPAAFTVVSAAHPSITSLTQTSDEQGTALAILGGSHLDANSRIRFDGAVAPLRAIQDDGSLVVAVPPAPTGHTATVAAANPDGQSSLQALAEGATERPLYSYGLHDTPVITAEPASLTPGRDTWIAIKGVNTHFADGGTTVGLGSSEVTVRQVWVRNPTFALVNVSVSAAIDVSQVSLTVTTGLESLQTQDPLAIGPNNYGPASLRLPVLNLATGLAGVPQRGTLQVLTVGLADGSRPGILGGALSKLAEGAKIAPTGWAVTIGGLPSSFGLDRNGTLTAQIPDGAAPGPNVLQLVAPDGTQYPPVLVQVDPAPPVIQAVARILVDGSTQALDADHPASPGDTLVLSVAGIQPSTPPELLWVKFAPVTDNDGWRALLRYPVLSVTGVPAKDGSPELVSGQAYVRVVLPADLGGPDPQAGWQLPLTLGTGSRQSEPLQIPLTPLPPAN